MDKQNKYQALAVYRRFQTICQGNEAVELSSTHSKDL